MSALAQLRRLHAALGIEGTEPWLHAPASQAEVAFTEEELGQTLPPDLLEILYTHNGGPLVDNHHWMSARSSLDGGLSRLNRNFDQLVRPRFQEEPEAFDPPLGPRTLAIASSSHVFLLYDMDDHPGQLSYCHVSSMHAVVPLAVSLERYFEAWASLAEADLIRPAGELILIRSAEDYPESESVLLDHGVSLAPFRGNDGWLSLPEARGFKIH